MPQAFSHHNIATDIEHRIRNHKLLDLPTSWSDEITYPQYEGLSLVNIVHSIAEILGAPLPDSSPLDASIWGDNPPEDIQRVVVYLSDGVGYNYLQQLLSEDTALHTAVADLTDGRGVIPLTSVAPSTTAVALPSLWTGAVPAAHGMLATTVFLREFSTIGNLLTYAPLIGRSPQGAFVQQGIQPKDFVPVAGFASHLNSARIPTHILLESKLNGTGLSRILHRGVNSRYQHKNYSDFWSRLVDVLRDTRGKHAYVNIYHPGVDTVSHVYGARNAYTHNEIRQQITQLTELLKDDSLQDGQTLFLFFADHGHADAPNIINLAEDQTINQALRLGLAGDMRLGHLHLRNGTTEQLIDYINDRYTDSLIAIESEKALAAGLYGGGTPMPETARRLGDVLLIPRQGWQVIDQTVGILKLVSWHGGLAADEMLIPFLWKTL